MRITEITASTGKVIKRLQRLYASYILNPHIYLELYDSLIAASTIDDNDLNREIEIVKEKLKDELIEILRK